jgi:hypothetical protein
VQNGGSAPMRRKRRAIPESVVIPSVTILTPLLVGGRALAATDPASLQHVDQLGAAQWVHEADASPASLIADIADFSASAADIAGVTFVHAEPELATISIAVTNAPMGRASATSHSSMTTFARGAGDLMREPRINNVGMSHVFGPVGTSGWYEVSA